MHILSRQLESKWQLWIVLLGTFLSTIACAIPLNPTLTQAAPSATKADPLVGCGDSLLGLKHPIEPTSGVIHAALNKLFSYKNLRIGESGLYNALWQSDLTLDKASVKDGVATVYLTGTVMRGGECDTPRFKGQIEQTILAQPGVTRADVFLNGKPIDEALSLK